MTFSLGFIAGILGAVYQTVATAYLVRKWGWSHTKAEIVAHLVTILVFGVLIGITIIL